MPNELKPCPFCGGEAVIDYGRGLRKYWVRCNNPMCFVMPETDCHEDKSIVREHWNMRADEKQDAELAKLHDAISEYYRKHGRRANDER